MKFASPALALGGAVLVVVSPVYGHTSTRSLSSSSSPTKYESYNEPLGNERVAAIIASLPSTTTQLVFQNVSLTAMPWKSLESLPNLDSLDISQNRMLTVVAANDTTLTALKKLSLTSNGLTAFDLRAPQLNTLNLVANKLVRIPESVFTYTQLQSLSISSNAIFRPLVLTAPQLQFLEALPSLSIALKDPPDDEIVSRLPTNGSSLYGNYSDSIDLSALLEGTKETLLWRNPLYPVVVVDSNTAATYNHVLEKRAQARGVESAATINNLFVPEDLCQGVRRNTLLSNCVSLFCPYDGACVAYDQDEDLDILSGCDYDVASVRSACALSTGQETCEFHCFGTFQPRYQFKFFIPFETEGYDKMQRNIIKPNLWQLTTKEIPFLSNSFVDQVGALQLTKAITEVWIAGGRSEKASRGRVANVVVSSKLLSNAPAVTSLSLLNLDLSKSDLGAIIGSSQLGLKSLVLSNNKLATVSEDSLAKSQQLETLTLAQNDITTLNLETTALPKLKTLNLRENALTSIEIDAPNLESLDLSTNEFDHVPPTVFSLTKLESLYLDNNPIEFPLYLSALQLEFLASIADLKLPKPPSSEVTLRESSRESSRAVAIEVASLVANGANTSTLRDIPVIVVSAEEAKQHNEQMEQRRKVVNGSASPRSSTSATSASTANSSTGLTSDGSSSTDIRSTGSSSMDKSSTGSSPQDRFGQTSSSAGVSSNPMDSLNSTSSSGPSFSQGNRTAPPGTTDSLKSQKARGVSLAAKLILVGLGVALFVVLLIVLAILRKRRSREANKASSYLVMTDAVDGSSVMVSQESSGLGFAWWKDDEIRSHRLNAAAISDVHVIGTGKDSSVVTWLVNYRAGSRQLVSKRLIQGEGAAHDAKMLQLVTEAKIASTLEYPSIVRFVGVAWTDKTDLQVLYEYMSNGDLGSYLASTDVSALPWGREKLQFAIDIIEALVYTHSFNPPVLHRNLKASNVLLDGKGKAKLGDFGCARPESESNTMTTNGVGSGRWLAPEILSGSTSYGASSDIYSFGVVLCELDTHQEPYAEEAVTIPETELLQRVARGELRPSLSASYPPEIREIAEACLMFNPENRPSAMHVAHRLRSLRSDHGVGRYA